MTCSDTLCYSALSSKLRSINYIPLRKEGACVLDNKSQNTKMGKNTIVCIAIILAMYSFSAHQRVTPHIFAIVFSSIWNFNLLQMYFDLAKCKTHEIRLQV